MLDLDSLVGGTTMAEAAEVDEEVQQKAVGVRVKDVKNELSVAWSGSLVAQRFGRQLTEWHPMSSAVKNRLRDPMPRCGDIAINTSVKEIRLA